MSEIINLKQQRKAKTRGEKEKKAEQNRQLFGRTKEQKDKEEREKNTLQKHLDAHKRDDEQDT